MIPCKIKKIVFAGNGSTVNQSDMFHKKRNRIIHQDDPAYRLYENIKMGVCQAVLKLYR